MVYGPTYEYHKRYRETRAERTARAYHDWNRILGSIQNAELEFDKREQVKLYHWLEAHAHIFQET